MGDDVPKDYSIGHAESALSYMRFRSATRCCGFFRDRVDVTSTVLDCGCGPGTITLGLAEWASQGRVVGIDIGEPQLEAARRMARDRGIGNVEFQRASVFALPFPDESFDVVFSQAMFCHIPNHAGAIAEIRRVLRPAGTVAIRDIINGACIVWPNDPLLREVQRIARLGEESSGGNPDVGLELGTLLDTAGFEDVFFSIDVEQPKSPEERVVYFDLIASLVDGDLGALAVREGWITSERLRDVATAFRGLATVPGSISCLPFGRAVGRKSAR
jgi:SAM-dependent methyltransferase